MKKQTKKQQRKMDDGKVTVKDTLGSNLFEQLQKKKQELQNIEETKQKQEEEKKREERRLREKNKSFEELLNDSHMDWKKYK